ncbi:hypothetical protein GHT06_017142 [Daphnia sinensis]|uniref:Uncharacterized protein n=1 Tax=Daphnia sinensis TaxID=1820382 RepID=A0AAD5KPG7_9CRUS|nr:hypothetical protein GHT06_017142 [Daphnia sinensis]
MLVAARSAVIDFICFWTWGMDASFNSLTFFCRRITWVLIAAISCDWIGVLIFEDCLSQASLIVIPPRNAILIIF